MGADLVRLPERRQECVQDPDWRVRGDARPVAERGLPKLLQSGREGFAHARGDVTVDAAHSGYLMAHALRLQDVTNAQVVQPGLVAVAQAVRCQTGTKRKPGGNRHGLGGLLA